ncbi:MAG: hypothetical protein Fur0028_07820 [Bacteroidales bacterium]
MFKNRKNNELYNEIFNYYFLRKKIFNKEININHLVFFKVIIFYIISKFEKRNHQSSKYLFVNSKFKDILITLGKEATIIGFKTNRVFAVNNNNNFKNAAFWGNFLNFIFKYKIKKKSVWRILEKNILDYINKRNIQYLVVSNDSAPLERFLIYVFRKEKKKSICIQHGINYNENYPVEFFDGNYVDELWLWSNVFYDSRKKSKQIIFGYPFKLEEKKEEFEPNSICLIGQDFYHYSDEYGRIFLEMIDKIINEVNQKCSGYKIYYKPHPNENIPSLLPKNATIYKGTLQESFQRFEFIIGINSTVLIEALVFKKKVIQIIGEDYFYVNFLEFGLSNIIHINELYNLNEVISNYKSSPESLIFPMFDNPGLEFRKRVECK